MDAAGTALGAGPCDDVVDEAVLLRLSGAHREVTIRITLDLLKALPGVLSHDLVHTLADPEDLPRVDIDLRSLTLVAL